jgi:opacity protein-like surface antigen
MKKTSFAFPLCAFLILYSSTLCLGADLKGKFAISAKGGLCYSLGRGFASYPGIDGRFGVGISAEYFMLGPLSAGLALAHNSFEGEWRRSGYYYLGWKRFYYTDWSWTSINLFTRFVLGPHEELSPYFKAGIGWYYPTIHDKWYSHPDSIYSHTSHGKAEMGFQFGFGMQYLLNNNLLVFLEIPMNFIKTGDSETHWVDIEGMMEKRDMIYDDSQIFNVFAGVTLLLGSNKKTEKIDLPW